MSEFKADVQGFELSVVTPEVIVANNVDQLVTFIEARVKDYDASKYEGDSDKAKKDRTELNKATEQVKVVRQKIQGLNPYGEIIAKLANAEKLIQSGSDALGKIVKAKEAEEKEAKRAIIQTIWDSKKFCLFPLDKVFDSRWLNKTYKITDIQNEIDSVVNRTYSDIKMLEGMENPEALKTHYLAGLDLSATMAYAKQLEVCRKRAEQEKAERAGREHAERMEAQKQELREEASRNAKAMQSAGLAADALEEELEPEVKEYTITVKVTETAIIGIKNYLNGMGVEYECRELNF